MIRVLIVDDSSTIRVSLEQALRAESDIEVVGSLGSGEEALEAIPRLNPDVTVMDIMMPGITGIDATRQISETSPVPVIIMSTRSEHELLQQAMQAGASEYLIKPFQFEDVTAAIRRVHALNSKRAAYRSDSGVQAYAPEVFAIFSAQGGVGKSQIAVNLASALRRATRSRVALMDFALYFGDVGLLLNLNPKRGIADLAKSPALDVDLPEMMQKGPHDIDVLLAPSAPEFAETVTTALIDQILRETQRLYDFVVMDLPSNLGEENLTALDAATRIVIVTDASIPSLKNTRLTLSTFDSIGIEPERLMLVVNHHQGRADRSQEVVQNILDQPIALELSYDAKVVERAIVEAQPFVDLSPETEISRQMRDLVGNLVPAERRVETQQGSSGGGGLRNRLFARR